MVEQQFAGEISYMITNSSELIPRLYMGVCRKSLWRTLLPRNFGTETLTYMWFQKTIKKFIPAEILLAWAERNCDYTK